MIPDTWFASCSRVHMFLTAMEMSRNERQGYGVSRPSTLLYKFCIPHEGVAWYYMHKIRIAISFVLNELYPEKCTKNSYASMPYQMRRTDLYLQFSNIMVLLRIGQMMFKII